MHFKKTILVKLFGLLIALNSGLVCAQATDKLKATLQKQLGPNAQIKSLTPSMIPGLIEVIVNNSIFYTDTQGKYLFQGEVIELKTGTNLTELRETEINKIKWSDLPLQNSIKVVRGDGSRKLAVFADPNCGYCKRLEKTFMEMDNITIYTFLMPILSPDSTVKAKQIWCSNDASKAWVNWMVSGTSPSGKQDCATPLEKNIALGKSFNISGTPAIFFLDGSRIPGAAAKEAIEKKLSSLNTPLIK